MTGARTPPPHVWCCLGEEGEHRNMVMTLEYLRIYFTLVLYLTCMDSTKVLLHRTGI